MTDTIKHLRRLHAEFIEACGPFKPYSYLVSPNEMHLSALRNAFETAAAVEIPKLLACAEALEYLTADVEAAHVSGALNSPPPTEHEHANLARARAALAALKGDA